MEMEMASQGAPHRYFWAWPTQELGPSYSHHRTVEIPPPKSRDLPLGSVSLLALMPTSSIATSGQKRGAQEGKVAAPPPTSPNGSVVHCSPQLEDLKQPTGEGSQGPGYTFWRRRLSSSSLTCLSFHPSTTSFCQEGQSVQDNRTTHPDPNKQVQQENSANSTTTPKTRSIPPGVARYFPWFGTTVSHDDMDRDRILSRPNQVLGDEEIPDGLT